MPTPTLLLPIAYVDDATKMIDQATSRVTFLCMMMTNDPATDRLIDAMVAAAKRGVKVHVAADVFTYGELGGHFIPFKYYTPRAREATRMDKELKAAGAKFTWLGRFSALPFTGRTHSKCLVVDDTVYSFGGVNLNDESLNYTDYMFRVDDAQLAMELRDEIHRLIEADGRNFAYRSHKFTAGKLGTVLIDGGFQGDSVIYRRACKLSREASKVLYVSQYCPVGKLSRTLKTKDAKLYFNQPGNAKFWNRLIIGFNMFFSNQHTHYDKKQYLHAKFMVFTMPDGKKIAITGSHNFVPGGVIFGTREVALETSDKKVIKQLEDFFEAYVR